MTATIVAFLVVLGGAILRRAWFAVPAAAARSRLDVQSPQAAGARRQPPNSLGRWADRAGVGPELVKAAWPVVPLAAAAIVATAALAYAWAGVIVAGVLTIATCVVAAGQSIAGVRRRRAQALPVLLEDVARGLRSGASLRQALVLSRDRVDPTLRSELDIVCETLASGGSLERALETWCERQPSEGLRLAVAALALGLDAGGAHGKALDGVAASLRDQLAVDRELAALSSQARASAGVMAIAPVGFATFAVMADRRTAHVLLGTPTGLGCLFGGLALDGIAALWMWRLTGAQR